MGFLYSERAKICINWTKYGSTKEIFRVDMDNRTDFNIFQNSVFSESPTSADSSYHRLTYAQSHLEYLVEEVGLLRIFLPIGSSISGFLLIFISVINEVTFISGKHSIQISGSSFQIFNMLSPR